MASRPRLPPALLALSAADATGSGLFLASAVMFFTRYAGLSAQTVGIGLSAAGVVGLLVLLPAGGLIARVGPRRALAGAYVVSIIGYLLYLTVHTAWTFLPLVCALRGTERTAGAAMTVLIVELTGEHSRVHGLSANRAMRNVGWAVGSTVAAVAIGVGTRAAFVALVVGNAASYALACALLQALPRKPSPPAASMTRRASGHSGRYRTVLRNRRYSVTTALGALTALLFSVQTVGMPLWVVRRTSAPPAVVGVMFALNATLVALWQVPAAKRASTLVRAGHAYRQAGLLVAIACLLFGAAASMPVVTAILLLTLGVVLLTLGEVLSSAAQFALSLGLAEPSELPRYLAFSLAGNSVQDAVGPVLVTTLIVGVGRPGWSILALLVALPSIAIQLLVRNQRVDDNPPRLGDPPAPQPRRSSSSAHGNASWIARGES
jgi:MFS family permease